MPRAEFAVALAGYAAIAFGGFALLGRFVAERTPTRLDVEAVAFRGIGVPFAVAFTSLGYWPALTAFGTISVACSYAFGARAWLLVALVASHAISQASIAGLKLRFRRTRPDYWLITKEVDTSYPSGHSATAVTFYLALMLLAWNVGMAPFPRDMATALLAACVAGIPWSRLALGAHYATDVLGGLLFGSAWLALSVAIVAQAATLIH